MLSILKRGEKKNRSQISFRVVINWGRNIGIIKANILRLRFYKKTNLLYLQHIALRIHFGKCYDKRVSWICLTPTFKISNSEISDSLFNSAKQCLILPWVHCPLRIFTVNFGFLIRIS